MKNLIKTKWYRNLPYHRKTTISAIAFLNKDKKMNVKEAKKVLSNAKYDIEIEGLRIH